MPATPTILITGASDGIGLALARAYHAQGARLILIGRRPRSKLDDAIFSVETYCQVDLAATDTATSILSWLHEKDIRALDLVIHNAALGYVGDVAKQPSDEVRMLLTVNLWAPMALTHALMPHVQASRGKFVFISSVVAALPSPEYAVYAATKAALEDFVRNWQIELAATHSPVRAQIIRPGATQSGMHAKSGAHYDTRNFASTALVATRIQRAIAGERRAVTLGWGNRIAFWTGRHLPWLVDWAFAHRQLREPAAVAAADTAPAARNALITGAADGIGCALAQQFAVNDYTIIGLDIDETRAQTVQQTLQAAGGPATFLIGNLAEPADQTRFSAALTTGPALTVAIHNAGINAVGAFSASDLERQRQVLAVNLTAPLILTAALLSGQKLPRGSTLVFISSLSYFVSYPGAAVYAASKAGLAAYARSLALALAAAGIHVLTVFPGPTRTAHARRYSPDNRCEEQWMTPDQVAAFVHQAVHRQQRQLIPGALNRLFAIGGRVAPLLFEQIMRRTLFEKLVAAQGETDE